ncbi:MAG: hypothetical protein ACRDIU_10360, partial [Actinomycetota bacterium]
FQYNASDLPVDPVLPKDPVTAPGPAQNQQSAPPPTLSSGTPGQATQIASRALSIGLPAPPPLAIVPGQVPAQVAQTVVQTLPGIQSAAGFQVSLQVGKQVQAGGALALAPVEEPRPAPKLTFSGLASTGPAPPWQFALPTLVGLITICVLAGRSSRLSRPPGPAPAYGWAGPASRSRSAL